MKWPPSSRSRSCPRKIAPHGIAPASTTTAGAPGAMIESAGTAIARHAKRNPKRQLRRENSEVNKMANYNRIILVGNLTRDPQLRYLPSQMAVVDFGLAVNHKFKTKTGEDRDEVLFIDCSCFGRGAEVINQYCQKGKQLLVDGRLKLDTWDDKQTG